MNQYFAKFEYTSGGLLDLDVGETSALGCAFGQGYHGSLALPVDQFMRFCLGHRESFQAARTL